MKKIHGRIEPSTKEDHWKDTLTIRQSLIRALKKPHCPFQVFFTMVGQIVDSTNSDQAKGVYFEQMCLGESSHNGKISDLPRLKSGEKSADQQRIDKQVENFQQVCKDYKIKLMSKQTKIIYKDKRFKYKLSGIIDAIGTIVDPVILESLQMSIDNDVFGEEHKKENQESLNKVREHGNPALFDLKLTSKISNQIGDWSWKHPQNMPATQPAMYTILTEATLKIKYPFYYLVFDYSPEMDYSIIRKTINQHDILELENDIHTTEGILEDYRKNGWDYNPEYYRCRSCPLLQDCPKAITVKPIVNV